MLLPPGTRLEVRVPELAGGTELATLTVSGADGRPFLAMYSSSPLPAYEWRVRDGRATVLGLPPGFWNLAVTAAGGRSWAASLTTSGGGLVKLDVE